MIRTRTVFMVVMLAFLSTSARAQQSGTLVIINVNVIDGVGAEPMRGASVVVRNGRIAEVRVGGPQDRQDGSAALATRAGATRGGAADVTVIDLKGKWLLPGFIDGHVHITDRSGARLALRSGVTTARSMG
ncbi:MAG: hypothetical protein ACRD5W_12480, partial [Candidatus Acidiferrales bacterium]